MELLIVVFLFLAVVAVAFSCERYLKRRWQSFVHGEARSYSRPWATAPVYHAEVVSHNFIQKLINFFKGQRREGYQFAVMVLSPAKRVTSENTPFRTRTRVPLTDSRCATHPPDDVMGNYIIARPDGHQHAESLLLDRFHLFWSLRTSYLACQTILLFTWLRCVTDVSTK